MMRQLRRIRTGGVGLVVPIVLVVAWWLSSADSTSVYFPPLKKILETFGHVWLFDRVGSDLIPSLERFAEGFALSAVLGIVLGLIIGLVRPIRLALIPIIDFLRSLPPPAIIPVSLLVFGIGDAGKVFVIVMGALWPVLISTIDGVRAVEPSYLAVARTFRMRQGEVLTRIMLPAASPQIFSGLRIAVSVSLLLMIVSEMVASTNGLGYFTLQAQQTFEIPQMWTGIVLLGLLGLLANLVVSAVEHRALAWHRGWRAASLGVSSAEVGISARAGRRVERLTGGHERKAGPEEIHRSSVEVEE